MLFFYFFIFYKSLQNYKQKIAIKTTKISHLKQFINIFYLIFSMAVNSFL